MSAANSAYAQMVNQKEALYLLKLSNDKMLFLAIRP